MKTAKFYYTIYFKSGYVLKKSHHSWLHIISVIDSISADDLCGFTILFKRKIVMKYFNHMGVINNVKNI